MGTVKMFENFFRSSSVFIRRNLVQVGECRNIVNKMKLWKNVDLTAEQKYEIQSFYVTHFGKEIPTMWHRLYQSYTGEFHYDYFPEYLFSSRLEPLTNPYREAEFLDDKNLLHTLFQSVEGVRIPKTYVSSIRGVLRNGDMEIISTETARKIFSTLGSCVVKKTVGTNSGKDVIIFAENASNLETIWERVSEFGKDYVVQELIQQSEQLQAINTSSVNTFRVISYICDDDIHVCPISLRMGRAGRDKDNMHYGGICVGVDEDGHLKRTAFSEFGESFDAHPDSGLVFEDYYIPIAGMQLRETAKKLHCLVPGMGIISWDLTIDQNNIITIIEMNTTGQGIWVPQIANGQPAFGNNTARMLEMIRRK